MNDTKVKNYVDYPTPKSIQEIKDHFANGETVWVKYHDGDCPDLECKDMADCNCCYGAFAEDFETDGMLEDCNEETLKRIHLVKD